MTVRADALSYQPYLRALTHSVGWSTAWLIASRRPLSMVDCVRFAAMRRHGLDTAFAFDPHFAEQGFTLIP